MDAVEHINNNLDIRFILEYYGFRHITETEDGFRACCKLHGGDNPTAFYWNKEAKLWCCYTGPCGGGDVFSLVQKLEDIGFKDSVMKVASILNLDIDPNNIKNVESYIRKDQEDWLLKHKPKSKNSAYEVSYTKYYNELEGFDRFSPETLEYFDAKFCKMYPTEKGMLYNKLVIPLFEKDVCVGVALRDTTGHGIPKWFYQPDGLKTGNILYNLRNAVDTIDKYNLDSIILVEGIFDVFRYHEAGLDNCVAIFGSSLKKEQRKTLLKLGVNFDLSFDNDNAGHKCSNAVAEDLKRYSDINIIQLPEGKDPADLTGEELKACYLLSKRKEMI